MRVGVIGCGAIAHRQHVPLLQAAGATMTAFASRSRASAEAACAEAGSGVVVDDWRSLVQRDDVDAVVVCTPNAGHAEQALAAMEAGKHVLVEKPLTVTVAEADALVAAAGAVVAMTAQSTRYAPPVAALRPALARIGEVRSFEASFCHGGPAGWAPDAAWFYDAALSGGGALMDLGPHVIDAVRWLLGDEIAEVAAVLDATPVEGDAVLAVRTAAGVPGTIHAGWRAPVRRISFAFLGTEGSVLLDDRGPVLHLVGADPSPLPLPDPGTVQQAFVDAVRSGVSASPDLAEGRAAVAVIAAAYESWAERRTVRVP